MNNISKCALTGIVFDPKTAKLGTSNPLIVDYHFAPIGRAIIALHTYQSLISNGKQFDQPILAGMCRQFFEEGREPPIITTEFLLTEFKNHKHPGDFKAKAYYLLNYLYHKGGKDYQKFNLLTFRDFPLCYSSDMDEFNRIMDFLVDKFLIKWQDASTFGRNKTTYYAVQLTQSGIEEIEKGLPTFPLVELVNQEISTGDPDVDGQINHAKDLFFREPRTMDKMRSACEALSFILEPLRIDLEEFFKQRDVSDFFLIVNAFDIRHNKDTTKSLVHEEQLEWVFYSLLNTITTYIKLKKKLTQ